MPRSISIFVFLFSLSVAALAWDSVDIAPGGSWDNPGAKKLGGVLAVSTVATGTVTLDAVRRAEVYTNAVIATSVTTNLVWRRIFTNETATVTNDYTTGQNLTPPLPPWLVKSQLWITNTVTHSATSAVLAASATVTNRFASFTCAGGRGYFAPASTNVFLAPGDTILCGGTAKGKVTLMFE